jgi:hypothetical protein
MKSYEAFSGSWSMLWYTAARTSLTVVMLKATNTLKEDGRFILSDRLWEVFHRLGKRKS